MRHRPRALSRAVSGATLLLTLSARGAVLSGYQAAPDAAIAPDPVVARIHEHLAGATQPILLVVDSHDFPEEVWNRVKHLVAFRLHRHLPDGTTAVDAAIYLVRDSNLYFKAYAALRNRTTNHEYVWCLLAAVVAHEAAHTAPMTERQALLAEAAQVRRCLSAGHLEAVADWNPGSYLQKVEANLRHPREHY